MNLKGLHLSALYVPQESGGRYNYPGYKKQAYSVPPKIYDYRIKPKPSASVLFNNMDLKVKLMDEIFQKSPGNPFLKIIVI